MSKIQCPDTITRTHAGSSTSMDKRPRRRRRRRSSCRQTSFSTIVLVWLCFAPLINARRRTSVYPTRTSAGHKEHNIFSKTVWSLTGGNDNIQPTSLQNGTEKSPKGGQIKTAKNSKKVGSRTKSPTFLPTTNPPTKHQSRIPTIGPITGPTKGPTNVPSRIPVLMPTKYPTFSPTDGITEVMSLQPSKVPSKLQRPSSQITKNPSEHPTISPTDDLTENPPEDGRPTTAPPSQKPTARPTPSRTALPSQGPTVRPTKSRTAFPSQSPTGRPTKSRTAFPSNHPSFSPTIEESEAPTPPVLSNPSVSISMSVFIDDGNAKNEDIMVAKPRSITSRGNTVDDIISANGREIIKFIHFALAAIICHDTDLTILTFSNGTFHNLCDDGADFSMPKDLNQIEGNAVLVTDFNDSTPREDLIDIQDRRYLVTNDDGDEEYVYWTTWVIRYPLIRVARPDLGNVVVEDAAMPQLESSAPAHGKVEGKSILQAQLILDKAMNSAISRGEVDKLLQVALKDKMVAASVPGSEVETFMKLVNGGPPSKDHASDQHMKRSEENYTFGNPFEIGVVVTLGGCAVAVIFLFVGRKKTRSRSRSSRRKSATSHLEDKVFSSDDFSFASESSASNMNDDVDMRTISTFTGISRSNETSSRMLGVFAPTDFSFATPEPSTLLTQPPSLHLSTALAPPTVLKSTPASNNNFVLPPTDSAAPFNEIEFGASSTEDASLSTDLSSRASVTSRLMKSRMSTPDKSVISSAERSNLSTPDKSRLSTPDSLSFASAGGGGSPTGTLVESANSLLYFGEIFFQKLTFDVFDHNF